MNKRLQQFLDLENLSPARLADLLGVQRSGVSHILSGRNKPGFDFIQKLLTKFPALSADWFLTGKGKPYKEMNNSLSSPAQNPTQFNTHNYGGGSQNSTQNGGSHMRDNLKNREYFQQEKNLNYYEKASQQERNFGGTGNFEERENSDESLNFNDGEKNLSGGLEREYINNEEFSNNSISNKEFITYNENSFSTNSINEKVLNFESNSNKEIIISNNNSSLESNPIREEINNSLNSYNKTSISYDNNAFEMDFETSGQVRPKNNFLEHNGAPVNNTSYSPDNMTDTYKNRGAYRHENQINETDKTQYQKKRSVNRVIVFYSDGSFEEFFPQQRAK